jgi:hypothetical protein
MFSCLDTLCKSLGDVRLCAYCAAQSKNGILLNELEFENGCKDGTSVRYQKITNPQRGWWVWAEMDCRAAKSSIKQHMGMLAKQTCFNSYAQGGLVCDNGFVLGQDDSVAPNGPSDITVWQQRTPYILDTGSSDIIQPLTYVLSLLDCSASAVMFSPSFSSSIHICYASIVW